MLQYLDTVVRLVPLVMGYSEQKQMVPVVLHEDYIDNFVSSNLIGITKTVNSLTSSKSNLSVWLKVDYFHPLLRDYIFARQYWWM